MSQPTELDPNLAWVVYRNINNALSDSSLSDGDILNFQELLSGFLSNETFQNALLVGAEENNADAIPEIIRQTEIADNSEVTITSSTAYYLVDEMQAGNIAILSDLANGYQPPITSPEVNITSPKAPAISLSTSQLDAFWNAEANLRLESLTDDGIGLHTYTHLIADPRYVRNFDSYAAAHNLSGDDVNSLREEIVAAHEDAAATLEKIEFDGLQIQYYSAANDFYTAIETENYNILGDGYTQPSNTNIFNGLGVTQPLAIDVLTEIQAPLEPIREDVFVNDDLPVITITPDPVQTPESSFISNLGELFVSAAQADTRPVIDTATPASTTPITTEVADTINLSFGDIEGPESGTTDLANSQNLSFAGLANGASPGSMIIDFDNAIHIGTNANINAAPELETYKVERGDSLWKIAQNEYGLTSAADIMRAVDHIARANGLENGADANHINPYNPNLPEDKQAKHSTLKMPTAEQITQDVNSIDWAELDRDTASHKQDGGHYAVSDKIAAAPITLG